MPKACQRISKSKVDINFHVRKLASKLYFQIVYPDEIKIITQSKDVDVHSLIGNIGGYLGLFLGKQNMLIVEIIMLNSSKYRLIKYFNEK